MTETAVCHDASKWECGICYEILIDPVVGNCGHDFCRGCLDRWRAHQGRDLKCPVCRGVFSDTGDKLGVCVRLREVVESLFPEKVAARRAELEQQAAASKKRSVERVQREDLPQPATLHGGRGGRRRLHARRHLTMPQHRQTGAAGPAASGSTAMSTGSTLLGFTMGWYERGCARGSGRRARAGRSRMRA
eukprot:gene11611-11755_t